MCSDDSASAANAAKRRETASTDAADIAHNHHPVTHTLWATDAACGLVGWLPSHDMTLVLPGQPASGDSAMLGRLLLIPAFAWAIPSCRPRLPALVLHIAGSQLAGTGRPVQQAADVGDMGPGDLGSGRFEGGSGCCGRLT